MRETLIGVVGGLLVGAPLMATTFLPMSFEDQLRVADTCAVKVLRIEPQPFEGGIRTLVTMQTLKDNHGADIPCVTGRRSGEFQATLPGGTLPIVVNGKVQSRSTKVPGTAQMQVNAKYLVYLIQRPGQSLPSFLQLGNLNERLEADPQTGALKFVRSRQITERLHPQVRAKRFQNKVADVTLEDFRREARRRVPNRTD